MRFKNIIRKRYIFLIFIFLGISLIHIIPTSYAQASGHDIDAEFEFHEYSEIFGSKLNISYINIELPESGWNITDIEANFTDIKLEREINIVEDEKWGENYVYIKNPAQKRPALGVQLRILEPTTIYGVFINGYRPETTTENITFQIKGYDIGDNTPNVTIYRTRELNISTDLGWYYQNFTADPIDLEIGNYSLVMNGSSIVNSTSRFYWSINDISPKVPNLHTSVFTNDWSTGVSNTTFLYKLVQKTEKSYNAQDINMTAELNGVDYQILNGSIAHSGSLQIQNMSYQLGDPTLVLHIKNNNSVKLIFNCSYNIKMENKFLSSSKGYFEENSENKWIIQPELTRNSNNFRVEFKYPTSWYNFTIFRKSGINWENITSIIDIDTDNIIITFPNNTIIEGAEWRIEANSPNLIPDINLGIREWRPGQTLQFTVGPTLINGNEINTGNLIFKLKSIENDYLPPPDFNETIQAVITEGNVFSYELPSNIIGGDYLIEIYWYNATDGGANTDSFYVYIPPPPFITPGEFIIIISSIIAGTIASLISYRTYNNYKKKKVERAQKVYSQCVDSLNLNYLMVTDKKSGLNVYTQNFSEREIDAAMISGFLQAIHTFGIELMKVEDRSQTIKLEYRDSIILMSEFVNLRLILMMGESPSRFFLYSVEELAYDIYKNYGDMIDNFNGDIKPFKGIEDLLRRHLSIAFIYPLKLAKIEKLAKIRINQHERELIDKAVHYMKSNDKDYFYISSILPEKECSPKDVEAVLSLFAKGVFELFPM